MAACARYSVRVATSRIASVEQFDQHLGAGGEFLRERDAEHAKAEFLAALELRPDDSKALGLLGLAYFQLDAFADALPIYERLVELNPSDASFWFNLGVVHLKLGKADLAIIEFAKSRELDPSQTRTVTYLGLAHARQGSYDRAYEAFRQVGNSELAKEMERHLTVKELAAIEARLAASHPESAVLETAAGSSETSSATSSETMPATPADDDDELGAAIDNRIDNARTLSTPRAGKNAKRPATEPPQANEAKETVETIEELSADDLEPISEEAALSKNDSKSSKKSDAKPAKRKGPPSEPPPRNRPSTGRGAWFSSDGDAIKKEALAERRGQDGAPSSVEGLITRAVHQAAPSQASATAALKIAAGHTAPQSLSEFATSRLIRPEDGEHPFEIAAGGVLIVRVSGEVMSRTEDVIVSGGDLGFEPATRRVRGESTEQLFGESDQQKMFVVSGKGFLVAAPGHGVYTAVSLDDDILFVRESLVYAFEEALSWENGKVPRSTPTIHVVQFRGSGAVALRSEKPLTGVKLAGERLLYVDAAVLAGWVGRVVPRTVPPVAGGDASATFVECTGEGVVLIEQNSSSSPQDVKSAQVVKSVGTGDSSDS